MLSLQRSLTSAVGVGLIVLIGVRCGTNPGNGADNRNPGGSSNAESATNVTMLKFQMPDRTLLAGEVKDISQKMDGYHLKIESVGSQCSASYTYEDINAIKDNGWVYVPASSNCDYVITVGFGPLGTATPPATATLAPTNSLSTHYYMTKSPLAVPAVKLKGKPEWKVPYWVSLQDDGAALGLKTTGLGDKPDTAINPPTPPPTATTVTWANDIKPIINTSCASCHGAGSPKGDFTTFANAQNHLDHLVDEVVGGSMPPSKPLSEDKKQLFQKWKDANFPEK